MSHFKFRLVPGQKRPAKVSWAKPLKAVDEEAMATVGHQKLCVVVGSALPNLSK
jgi:hypothetical protein